MNIRTSAAVLAGSALTLLIVQPWVSNDSHTVETFVHTQVEEVMTTIDLDRYRDVPAETDIDEQLNYECTIALQRLTDEPLMGIILYLEEHWHGDACAAYEHQVLYGWY